MTERPPLPELRDVPGYEGLYGVTRDGRVYSYRSGLWLKFDATQGYPRACLCRYGVCRFVKVHRLVAQAFVRNPLDLPQVNHRDGDKRNNAAANLEWVTHRDNQLHAEAHGLKVRAPNGTFAKVAA